MNLYEWLLLISGVTLLTVANYRFYFGIRRTSYLFFILATASFVVGFLSAGLAREDYTAALTLMLIYLIAYVVERAGFILLTGILRKRAAKRKEHEEEEPRKGGEQPGAGRGDILDADTAIEGAEEGGQENNGRPETTGGDG